MQMMVIFMSREDLGFQYQGFMFGFLGMLLGIVFESFVLVGPQCWRRFR